MSMTEKQLLARDAKRDIGVELLLSVRQMKAGQGKVVAKVDVPTITEQQPKALKQVFGKLASV